MEVDATLRVIDAVENPQLPSVLERREHCDEQVRCEVGAGRALPIGAPRQPAIAKCSPAATMRRTIASSSRRSAVLKGSSRLILATYGIRRRFIAKVSSPFRRMAPW
jgi:hypothetical protein